MFIIDNWNIEENQKWFVRLADGGSGIVVSLHTTQADAENNLNAVASATTAGFGAGIEVTFPDGVNTYLPQYAWHMVVSGASGDPTRILSVGPFADLPEISHRVYVNEALGAQRAKAEIDAHTHASIQHVVQLGTHLPEIDVGDVCRISSARAGGDFLGQIMEHRISGTPGSLQSTLEVMSYLELTR